MKRMLFVVMSFGVVLTIASAQDQVGDLPLTEPNYLEVGYAGQEGEIGGYGMRGAAGMTGTAGRVDPRQTQKLIESWKVAKDASERDRIEKSLREILNSEFSARLAAHEKEIKNLEEKVRQLRQRLTLRREKQDDIVQNRLEQILRDAQGLGWGSEGMNGQAINWFWQPAEGRPLYGPQDLLGPVPMDSPRSALPGVSEDSVGIEPEVAPLRN